MPARYQRRVEGSCCFLSLVRRACVSLSVPSPSPTPLRSCSYSFTLNARVHQGWGTRMEKPLAFSSQPRGLGRREDQVVFSEPGGRAEQDSSPYRLSCSSDYVVP